MKLWRKTPAVFGIGTKKSPHVLDLRPQEETIRKISSEQKKATYGKETQMKSQAQSPLSKDTLLEEIEGIEDRDERIALSLEVPITAKRRFFGGSTSARRVKADFTPQLIPRGKDFFKDLQERSFLSHLAQGPSSRARAEGGIERKSSSYHGASIGFAPVYPGGDSRIHNIRTFAILAGTLAFLLFGGFFVHKGFSLKHEATTKGVVAFENFLAAEEALKSFDFNRASQDFSKAYENLASAEESLGEIGGITISIVENLPFESRGSSSIALLRAAKHVAKAGEILSSGFTLFPRHGAVSAETILTVFAAEEESAGQQGSLIETFHVFEERLALAESELIQAEYEMARVNADDFPAEFQDRILELRQKTPTLLKMIGVAKDYSKISTVLLGAESPKRYLILFQNSSELRPSGGFIGSYALIEIDQGKLINMAVKGIYDADGQLTVNVIPPYQFQHITTSWSTHDANWFLDFPTSARKISWFYERTGAGKVDGVITLNVEVIEQLLALTGPISIGQYDLILDSQNFRDEIQYEVEAAYDKKLNRPKQILSDFTPIFLERLIGTAKESNKEIISIFMQALGEKLIMFYFDETTVQGFFENQGWTGSIVRVPSDYLAVVHSNIGGHKTSKYMQEEINHRVEIQGDGSITGHLRITRTHSGGNTKYWWYNRNNVDYVKMYVPQGSELISYSGGQRREVAKPVDYTALNFIEDPEVSAIEATMEASGPIDIFNESGKVVFGTWLVTKPGTSSVLEIDYKLPFQVEFTNGVGKYVLFLQKQPGTRYQASVALTIPDRWEIVGENLDSASPENFVLDKDRAIEYIFMQ